MEKKKIYFLILISLNLFDDFSSTVSVFIYVYFVCVRTQKFPGYKETQMAKNLLTTNVLPRKQVAFVQLEYHKDVTRPTVWDVLSFLRLLKIPMPDFSNTYIYLYMHIYMYVYMFPYIWGVGWFGGKVFFFFGCMEDKPDSVKPQAPCFHQLASSVTAQCYTAWCLEPAGGNKRPCQLSYTIFIINQALVYN